MTFDFTGTIYSIPFPGDEGQSAKARPALVLSEPDAFGDLDLAFITTDHARRSASVLELPDGLLPIPALVHLDQLFRLPPHCLGKKLARIEAPLLEKILRECCFNATKKFHDLVHGPRRDQPFLPCKSRINYGGRVFDEQEMVNLTDASLDFWLTAGRYAREFEQGLARFLGVRFCSLTNSGSSANLLAFMALTSPELGERRICQGDEIITVAAAFPTTVTPLIHYGAIPVFLDIILPDYNIDCNLLEMALSPRTKAVILAHTLGNPFDLEKIKAFCDKHQLWLIEDTCDALGSRYLLEDQWRYAGSMGDLGTFSFFPPHHITMGEGGAICTNDEQLRRLVESYRDWGRDCYCPPGSDNTCGKRFSRQSGELPFGYDHKYVFSHFGFNLKATDLQAAIGCAQLNKLPDFIAARQKNWNRLRSGLADLADLFILPEPAAQSDPSWFGFALTVRPEAAISRDGLVAWLESGGVQTRMLFSGNLIRHPCFDEMRATGQGFRTISDLAVTDTVMRDTFWIGVYPGMTPPMLDYMISRIRKFCRS